MAKAGKRTFQIRGRAEKEKDLCSSNRKQVLCITKRGRRRVVYNVFGEIRQDTNSTRACRPNNNGKRLKCLSRETNLCQKKIVLAAV